MPHLIKILIKDMLNKNFVFLKNSSFNLCWGERDGLISLKIPKNWKYLLKEYCFKMFFQNFNYYKSYSLKCGMQIHSQLLYKICQIIKIYLSKVWVTLLKKWLFEFKKKKNCNKKCNQNMQNIFISPRKANNIWNNWNLHLYYFITKIFGIKKTVIKWLAFIHKCFKHYFLY